MLCSPSGDSYVLTMVIHASGVAGSAPCRAGACEIGVKKTDAGAICASHDADTIDAPDDLHTLLTVTR